MAVKASAVRFATLVSLLACTGEDAPVEERPEGLLMVADSGNARVLFADHGTDKRVGEICLSEVFPDACTGPDDDSWICLVFGVDQEPDSDALRVVYASSTLEQVGFPGGIVALDPAHPPDVLWSVDRLAYPDDPHMEAMCAARDGTGEPLCQLNMPHMAEWMPDGETLVVADTLNNRVVWLRPSGPDVRSEVVATLLGNDPALEHAWWPNAVQVIEDGGGEEGGRTLLLITFKGSDPEITGGTNMGRIQLWDVTELDAMEKLWAWPGDGYLAAVHGGRIVAGPGGDTLLYGHAYGASDDADEGLFGSVGVARVDLPDAPVYLADVEVEGVNVGFVRQADWLAVDGPEDAWELLLTDSGCEDPYADCALPARISELRWEEPPDPGLTGAWSADHAEQAFVALPEERQGYIGGLRFPFESRLFGLEEAPDAWWDLGGCE